MVITLRNCIHLEAADFEKELPFSLWNIFLNCRKMTRTLICLTFGLECVRNQKINKKYGLDKVFKNYKLSDIKKAQSILKSQILKQISITKVK